MDKIKILSTTSNIYWKYFCTNKLQDISIAKYCQAQPSPSLAGLSSYISKTRVSSKVRLFDRFQFKESELDRFEKLDSCAALVKILDTSLSHAEITSILQKLFPEKDALSLNSTSTAWQKFFCEMHDFSLS